MMAWSKIILTILCSALSLPVSSWGFYVHRLINRYAVFLLPPEMLVLYKPHIDFLSEHAVDPDKRRYILPQEGARHYIDIDRYGAAPYPLLPRDWKEAVVRYSEDTLQAYGIVPWWIEVMMRRLTAAFKERNQARILKLSAEIGHYISDAHVPLHASSNHNGQLTNQQGIHGLWESRGPELLAEKEWDFLVGKADYIKNTSQYVWSRVLESATAADSVLRLEKKLSERFPADQKYAFENRNGAVIKQYSSRYVIMYDHALDNMAERRFRQSVYATASYWYTAWVNAGQPDLSTLSLAGFSDAETKEFEELNTLWNQERIKGRSCD